LANAVASSKLASYSVRVILIPYSAYNNNIQYLRWIVNH
jgi:predicted transcriptional regulator